MDAKFTQAERADLYKQGTRFITTIEAGSDKPVPFFDINADDVHHARVIALTWIDKHDAVSAATHRIYSDGSKNLVRFYDHRDVGSE